VHYKTQAIRSNSTGPLQKERVSQLFLGNCLDVLPQLPDGSVDCIITDPPYGINYQSRSHFLPLNRIANDDEGAHDLLDESLAVAWRKLKNDRLLYVFTNWQAYPAVANVVKKHFNLKNVLV
jgi:DNA modification methylase